MSALSITILVCAAGLAPRDCTAETAVAVIKPSPALYADFSGYAGCERFSQLYTASLHYMEPGADGKPAAYIKPRCSLGAPAGSVG
jgi:hypothetical protein